MARAKSTESLKKSARASDDALFATLQRLAGRVTGQADLLGLASSKMGESVIATAAAQGLRKHPVATVLVGAGLAWLAWGHKDEQEDLEDEADGLIDEWRARADEARDTASERLSALYDDLSAAGSDAKEFAREKAAITADLAQDLADAFNHGLETMTDDAAGRVSDAREAAYSALSSGITKARSALGIETQEDTDLPGFIRRHPVASVGVAVALGAALAAALQANRRSDGALAASVADGASNLLARAREVLDTETDRAGRKISEAASEIKSSGGETAVALVRELASLFDRARSRVSDVQDDVEEMADDTVETVKATAKRARSSAEDGLREAKSEVKSHVRAAEKTIRKSVKPRKSAAADMMDKITKSRS